MKTFNLKNLVRVIALALSLGLAPFALNALAQNTGTTTTTQSNPPAQTTTTTRQTHTETTTTTVNPLWWVLGAIALLAILLIVILSSRGRSRNRADTVYESKTVVKKE